MIAKLDLFKVAAVALSFVAIGYPWYLKSTGYCFDKGHYLTDAEYIEIAVRHNLSDMKIDNAENNIGNFYIENSNCCSVDRSSHMTSAQWENLLGSHYVEVEINYEGNPKYLTNSKNKFYTSYTKVMACGDIGSQMGEEKSTLKSAKKS